MDAQEFPPGTEVLRVCVYSWTLNLLLSWGRDLALYEPQKHNERWINLTAYPCVSSTTAPNSLQNRADQKTDLA